MFTGRLWAGVRVMSASPIRIRPEVGLEAGEHPKGRRLAAPGGAEEREELPAGHVEGQVDDGVDVPVSLAETVERDRSLVDRPRHQRRS